MHFTGPIAQPGSELPAHNRLVPGSNPGGPIPLNTLRRYADRVSPAGKHSAPRAQPSGDSIAGRVDQIRDETTKNQSELDRLTEQDKEISTARKKAERELAEGEVRIRN